MLSNETIQTIFCHFKDRKEDKTQNVWHNLLALGTLILSIQYIAIIIMGRYKDLKKTLTDQLRWYRWGKRQTTPGKRSNRNTQPEWLNNARRWSYD